MVLKFPYKDKAQWVLCEKEKTELILYGILTMMKEHHLRTGVDKIEFICQPHYS
jgi:hypothetical protein